MKKIKLIVTILFIIILSGCSVNANISMNEKGNIEENIEILTPTENISNDNEKISEYLEVAVSSFKKALKMKNYSWEKIIDKENSGIKVKNNYKNICEYFKSNIGSIYLYTNIECTENKNYFEIKNKTDFKNYESGYIDRPNLDEVKVNFKLPCKAMESNADEEYNNTYTWNYTKETKNKDFYLKIGKEDIKESYNNYLKEQEKIKERNRFIFIIISVIISVLIFLGLIRYYKKTKFDTKNLY